MFIFVHEMYLMPFAVSLSLSSPVSRFNSILPSGDVRSQWQIRQSIVYKHKGNIPHNTKNEVFIIFTIFSGQRALFGEI
jgi:hypothetical protein